MARGGCSTKRLRFANYAVSSRVAISWNAERGAIHVAHFLDHSDLRDHRVPGGLANAPVDRLFRSAIV